MAKTEIKFTIKSDKLSMNLPNTLKQIFTTQLFKELSEEAREMVYRRVKSGKGCDASGNETRLKALSDDYIEQRKYMDLGDEGTPRKSNATKTGAMLKAMKGTFDSESFGLKIEASERDDSSLSNEKVAQYYQEERPFLGITLGEMRILIRKVELKIRSILDNFKIDVTSGK